jgi:hypothetical protein
MAIFINEETFFHFIIRLDIIQQDFFVLEIILEIITIS